MRSSGLVTLAGLVFLLSTLAQGANRLSTADRAQIETLGKLMVEASNETDEGRRRALIPSIFAQAKIDEVGIDRLMKLFDNLHQTLGPLEYHHSEASEHAFGDDFRVVLHAFAQAQAGWKDLQMRVTTHAPYRVTEIAFVADVSEPVYLPNGDITSAETLEWMNDWIDRLVEQEDLAASVLIAEGDKIIYERAVGFADAARSHRVTMSTAFGMASGSKMFTAVVLGQLVDEAKLSWDDPISRFLPDWSDMEFARVCTVRQLLSHTSGLKEYWTDRFEREGGSIKTLPDFVPFIEGSSFPPGERFEYSNSNYIVAGLIVEAVTRQSYFDAVRDRIWKPAGMSATTWGDEPSSADVAERLTGQPRAWTRARTVARSSSAGGATTTAHDGLVFSRALLQNRLVSAPTLRTMTTAQARGEGEQYGLGFELASGGGVRSFGHGGIAPGCNFELRVFPGRQMTLVVLGNQDSGAYDDLRRNLTKLITGER